MSAVAADPVPELPAYAERILRWKTATLASIAVALWVTLEETDRLIAGAVPAGGGASRTASGLQGPDAGPRADSWAAWRLLDPGAAAELSRYLQTYAIIDTLFALSYFWLLWRAVRRYRWLGGLAWLVLGCELGESVTLAFLSTHLEAGGAAVTLVVLAYLKWGLLALLGISVLYYRVLRRLLVLWLRRTRQAVLIQRLSFFAVLAIAAMALIPIPGVSDQLPDAARLGSGRLWGGPLVAEGQSLPGPSTSAWTPSFRPPPPGGRTGRRCWSQASSSPRCLGGCRSRRGAGYSPLWACPWWWCCCRLL